MDTIKGPIIMMNQLKSIYNSPFKSYHSHPIHTCLATIASNVFQTELESTESIKFVEDYF